MRPYGKSLKEYGRGIAGGLLFSLPMLYTMEVWWAGFIVNAGSLLVALGATFVLLIGYNRFAGMRKDASYGEVVVDSVEELGIGLVFSFFILWMLDRIVPGEMNEKEIVGKVVIEAMTVAIGISIGTAQLGKNGEKDKGVEGDDSGFHDLGSQTVLAICGGVIIGANLAPTEEISMIATDISDWQALLLVVFSLGLTLLVMSYIDFTSSSEPPGKNRFKQALGEASYSYVLALGTSAFVLWFFNHFEQNDINIIIKTVIVLGVATGLGASAGRLLLKD